MGTNCSIRYKDLLMVFLKIPMPLQGFRRKMNVHVISVYGDPCFQCIRWKWKIPKPVYPTATSELADCNFIKMSMYIAMKTIVKITRVFIINTILPRLLQRSKDCRGHYSTLYHATSQWIMRSDTHLFFDTMWRNPCIWS